MNKFKAFVAETRASFLTVTVLPVILGFAFAYRNGARFGAWLFIMVMLGFIFIHLGTNVLNDYYDDKNGTDRVNKNFISPFTGGSRLIQAGVLRPAEVLAESVVFFSAGTALFILVSVKSGPYMLFFTGVSLLAGVFYTAPPFRWAHRGLGELMIFFGFGPITVTGAYYAAAGSISAAAVIASVPAGLLAASIVDINQFPDFEADKKTGKNNMVVRLGRKKGVVYYNAMVIAAYAVIAGAAALGIFSRWALVSLAGLFFSLNAMAVLKNNFDKPEKLAPACGMTIAAHLTACTALIFAVVFG